MSTQAIESSPQRPRIEKAKRKKDMSHLLHYILTNVSHNTEIITKNYLKDIILSLCKDCTLS